MHYYSLSAIGHLNYNNIVLIAVKIHLKLLNMRIKNIDNKIISVLLLCMMLIYIIIYRFLVLNYCLKYEEFITSSFFIILTVISISLLGFRINKIERVNDSKVMTLVTIILLYFSLIYCIGFFKGFLQNSYSLTLKHVFLNTICPIINLICLEIIRYVVMWSNKKNKSYFIVCVFAFTFLEVLFNFNFYNLHTIDGIFELICLLIVKSFMNNFLLCYMCSNMGLKPCIIYKMFISIYLYLIPIIPDLGLIIGTVIDVLFPLILWLLLNKIITLEEYYLELKPSYSNSSNNILFYLTMIFALLLSGITPIKMMTIVSPSMEPRIMIGDMVVVNSLSNKSKLSEGDIIAFKHDGVVIVHRIYEIRENTIQTKGDFNNDVDNFTISDEDIIGKVLFNIPYLGYPSIYFSKLIGGN